MHFVKCCDCLHYFLSDTIKYKVFRFYPIFGQVGRHSNSGYYNHFTPRCVIRQSVKTLTDLPHILNVNDPLVFLSVLLTFMTSFLMEVHGNVHIFFFFFFPFYFFLYWMCMWWFDLQFEGSGLLNYDTLWISFPHFRWGLNVHQHCQPYGENLKSHMTCNVLLFVEQCSTGCLTIRHCVVEWWLMKWKWKEADVLELYTYFYFLHIIVSSKIQMTFSAITIQQCSENT